MENPISPPLRWLCSARHRVARSGAIGGLPVTKADALTGHRFGREAGKSAEWEQVMGHGSERRINLVIVLVVVAVLVSVMVAIVLLFRDASQPIKGEDSMDHIVSSGY